MRGGFLQKHLIFSMLKRHHAQHTRDGLESTLFQLFYFVAYLS